MSDAFKGLSGDKQNSDANNKGIGNLLDAPKLQSEKAPTLGGSAQSATRGKQGNG